MATKSGACHCGRVSFEFDNAIDGVIECNCSICHRTGALWHAAPADQFRILSGAESLETYQFGIRTAKHYFCKTCGVSPFCNPRIAPHMWAANLRCVDDIDLYSLPKYDFGGHNWEQAAEAFMRSMKS